MTNYFDVNFGRMKKQLFEDQKEVNKEIGALKDFTQVLSKGKRKAQEEYELLEQELSNLKRYEEVRREKLYEALERTRPEEKKLNGGSSFANNAKNNMGLGGREKYYDFDGDNFSSSGVHERRESVNKKDIDGWRFIDEKKFKDIKRTITDLEEILDY